MIIDELNLIGFGKFNNKTIQFQQGINIIYGENEAGKTTVHSFINGMFYGFLKPYARRTIYLEEHEKYNPWSSSRYAGLIKFKYDGKNYSIEREFTKGNESTLVLLDDTGEDITNSIDNGNKGRVLQPGFHFFGFNDAVYSNTISIKQLGSKTEESLAGEVRDKLVNVSTTLDDTLSIERAIEELDKSLKDIGTIRATTSNYGRLSKELEELKIERKRILAYKAEYNQILDSDASLNEEIKHKEKELEFLKNRLNNAMVVEKIKIYNEAKDLEAAIVKLDSRVKKYEKYRLLSMEDYSKGINLSNRLEYLNERNVELENQLAQADARLEDLQNTSIKEIEVNDNLDSDYMRYEELEEEKSTILYNNDRNQMEFLKRDYQNSNNDKGKYNLICLINLILSIGLSIFSIITSNYTLLLVNVITVGGILYSLSKIKDIKVLIEEIQYKIGEMESKDQIREDTVKEIEETQDIILKKYNVKSKVELKGLLEEIRHNLYKNRERNRVLIEEKENILGRIEELKNEEKENNSLLKEILNKNMSSDLDEFKKSLEKKEMYEDTIVELETKKHLLDKVLGKFTLIDLERDLKEYINSRLSIEENLSADELKKNIDEKNQEISNEKIEKRGLEERLKVLNRELSKLVEIDEEIKRNDNLILKLDKKREAIEMAKNTIESLSKDIHRQFAPTINKKIGRIIENITDGKYTNIRVDDKLDMGISNPITGEIINVNSLSGGTIDQLYFSLRYGVIDSIREEAPPLILDDCFIQYDDNRLKNMMNFLLDISKDRQIILFTCHKREMEILDKMGEDFNLIKL
ncbi:ATP-binding protein [Wansuia hejianensis]|uniref:AAA family ATPase n=1 Tax=Wansuia hejianensis TaxID=2763667 RepID=A0A926EYL1_9FIRM|nr:AAA family ATPase [Wansuia hejianensis]MBC8591341.1 AAA family ATPase [Wansuia hejianensis]